ncbi:MAG: MBOAT family O-acyltransferase [Thermodesulfobacteriota bacterium]|nr:MBOAT family O-acyltransferase [Thermodesulfobacteriota bacterium]
MCWEVSYVFLILITTIITYLTGIGMGRAIKQNTKRMLLILCLTTNLLILFIFKYFNFFNDTLRSLFDSLNLTYNIPALNLLLPVGISFYTFQSLSYAIDVYNGRKKPETHFGIFAVYVAFFPQLVAGPIERSTKLLPQFYKKIPFDYANVTNGLRQMGWGFFKKIVIADRLAILVDQVYNTPSGYTGIPLIVASYFFAFQIYCDFSGYSDIAIGAARVLGIDLSKNFNYPYFATNIMDFWRRWHITLTSWFRDYLYIPLGGNRVSWQRWSMNIIIVFFLSGLWHGAYWTFVIWGTLHGLFILATRVMQNRNRSTERFIPKNTATLRHALSIIVTFHIVTLLWVFFRANTIQDAFYILANLLNFNHLAGNTWQIMHDTSAYFGMNLYELLIALFSICFLVSVEFLNYRFGALQKLLAQPVALRWAYYYLVTFLIVVFGQFSINSFIYFQF